MEATPTQTLQQMTLCLKTSRWYHAVTLTERIASLCHKEMNVLSHDRASNEQALKKLQRWKEQAPFDNKASLFANRLAMDALTEQDLLTLLTEPIEAVQERLAHTSPPIWLSELAYSLGTDAFFATIAHLFQQVEDSPGAYAILQPFYPLLRSGIERLQAGIAALSEEYNHLPFDPETILSLLLPNLAQQMITKLSRAVVLELNIARLRGQLQGDTPQERFHYYLQHLSQQENLRVFLEEYCILARQLLVTIDLWVDCNLEFCRHLCRDWEQILATFVPERDPGALTKVEGGAGDTHRNGHSVMILTFYSGWRLVYKPRSLSIDMHFQGLLIWLNARGHHPPFRLLQLINKTTYGWVEFVPDAECASEDEVIRFYERQGGYLALLHVLNATDFHAENVIAAGEHPLLVDLEALFHPSIKDKYATDLARPAQETLVHSVMRIALLPLRVWSNDEIEGVDISGLGTMEGHLSPRPMPQWEGMGTDEMKLIRARVKMAGSKNCPKLHGQNVQALNYIESIMTGFTSMYRLLIEHRDAFVAEILPQFAHDEIRFIARDTRTYALLLNESFHPNILRDALRRERFFDRLWIAVEHQPYLQRLIPAERADLFRGDIPLFTTYPGSRDLFSSQGESISQFFPELAIELVKKRLEQLGDEDLHRQRWMIRAAFTSTPAERVPTSNVRLPSHPFPEQVSHECLLSEARAIGDRLCKLALQGDGTVDWIGLTFMKEREWSITPAGIDLYSGLPGIILFLSYLGTITGETYYTTCAMAALKTLRAVIGYTTTLAEPLNIGAFNGIGSCIYLFSHLASLWNDPSLLQEAEDLVQLLPEWIARDDQFDIVDGSAGCIASLLSLYVVSWSPSTLTAAVQCGDRLLACAQSIDGGVGWKTFRQETPLTGFSHGAAGIAYSLLKLAAVSGEERFRQEALAALTYERRQFSQEKQNWLDLRRTSQTEQEQSEQIAEQVQQCGMSWSHGAPGIALARLASLCYIDDEATHQEIEIALTTILKQGFGYHQEHIGPNHSLAHGDFGNLEALLLAIQTLDMLHLSSARDRIAARLLESRNQYGWIMGVPLNVETPGLMIGLAGIGYELLRLTEPERVPSVLTLAPPAIKR